MTLERLLNQPLTIGEPTSTVDAEGNVVSIYTERQTWGRLEQTDSVEVSQGRTTVTSDWRIFLPPGDAISAPDRVRGDGRTFEVVGAPSHERTPRGDHHTVARLIHVEG